MQETQVQSLGGEDLLEEETATHSSILAWEIPWTEEPGGLQSMGLQSQTQLNDWAQYLYTDRAPGNRWCDPVLRPQMPSSCVCEQSHMPLDRM